MSDTDDAYYTPEQMVEEHIVEGFAAAMERLFRNHEAIRAKAQAVLEDKGVQEYLVWKNNLQSSLPERETHEIYGH